MPAQHAAGTTMLIFASKLLSALTVPRVIASGHPRIWTSTSVPGLNPCPVNSTVPPGGISVPVPVTVPQSGVVVGQYWALAGTADTTRDARTSVDMVRITSSMRLGMGNLS
jgi:hypothetical protein